ncbi:uncharacterized protein PGRI_090260 [Penicillium griseofulvum]|uniref:Protein kinase domain-containing protein n=1 Tax=Penicillium patulum TaxID=5078 RepID=A0A135LRQ6_PENPA|nr:uncharacterized protein PGRI_090260 [Penicillium griseofulvum]KXG51633.1 hypothetical protein PGRI_090260 [Penicillium griseofulvum]
MATPPLDNPQLAILEMNETFEDINGSFGFAGTSVVYRMNGELYHGMLKARYYPSTIVNSADLANIIQIPSLAYSPLYTTELTRAQDPSKDTHVKRPRLISYDRIYKSHPNAIAESILAEAKVCELLLQYPHSNIAIYHGCQVSGDRIRGLCFTKYSHTLMKEVNSGALMKRQARSMRKTSKDYSSVLAGVESGIRHLHSLGLVHNDINPSSIMFDGDELVIIDFGSCRSIGESRGGGTYEWYDEKVQLSLPENDLNALEEIRIWLGDDLPFQFET